jgi:DNA-binding XRE family transcriptional regulator
MKTPPTMALTPKQKKALKAMGGRVTTVQEFLGLSDEDMAVIEARAALSAAVKKGRIEAGLTQAGLALRIGSTQSRVAKMEAGDPQASLEALMRALAATGYHASVKIKRARAA